MRFERISVNPGICHGQACIEGTRIPFYQVVQVPVNGDSIDDLPHFHKFYLLRFSSDSGRK
ncbi:MAG: DUF433 domain-containing protein [Candidatus Aminicenantes bacterium]|nr:DUF433 domain-containing protein [Candidatus Aminicenantes bacterium]